MQRKSWHIITAGLLLSGIPAAVWLGTGPAHGFRRNDPSVSSGRAHAGIHGAQGGTGRDATGKRRRERGQIPALNRILADLGATTDDDFAARVEKTAAGWPKDDLPSAVASLFTASGPGPGADSLGQALLCRWALHAPAAAAGWAGSLPSGPARQPAIMHVALAWHSLNPDAAWNWSCGLEDGAPRESALMALAYEVSRDDPRIALERSETLRDSQDRKRLIEHAVANWAAIDPQAALAHAKEIEDSDLRQTALGCVAASWSESDPRGAAALVAEMMDPGPAQERAVASVIQRWARLDPGEASAWVSTFPEGRMKQNSLDHIAAVAATSGPEHD